MITFTEAQVLGWITPLLWPFLRVLALFTALPVLGTRSVPARVRVGLARSEEHTSELQSH